MSVITFNMPQAVDFSTVAQLQNNAYNSWNKGIEGLNKTHKDFVSDVKNDNLERLQRLAHSAKDTKEYYSDEFQAKLNEEKARAGNWIDTTKAMDTIKNIGTNIWDREKSGIERNYTLKAEEYKRTLVDLSRLAQAVYNNPHDNNAIAQYQAAVSWLVDKGVSPKSIQEYSRMGYGDGQLMNKAYSEQLTNEQTAVNTAVTQGNYNANQTNNTLTASQVGVRDAHTLYPQISTSIGADGRFVFTDTNTTNPTPSANTSTTVETPITTPVVTANDTSTFSLPNVTKTGKGKNTKYQVNGYNPIGLDSFFPNQVAPSIFNNYSNDNSSDTNLFKGWGL